MSREYDDLAARAARGELAVKPGTVRRGAAAAEEAQRALMAATETTSIEALTRVALGRPSLGDPGGASPVIRARVPQALKDLVTELAAEENVKESDIVRDALAAYTTGAQSQRAPVDHVTFDGTTNLQVLWDGKAFTVSRSGTNEAEKPTERITMTAAELEDLFSRVQETVASATASGA